MRQRKGASVYRRPGHVPQRAPLARHMPEPSPVAILLGFVPFILFAVLTNVSIDLALWTAFAAAFAISIRDFAHSRLLRALDVGSLAVFGLLSLYVGFIEPGIPVQMARLVADGSFFVMALVSMLLRNPITLQYAREQVQEEFWKTPRFILTNYLITAGWAAAFAVMALTDAVANMNKRLPLTLDLGVCLAVLVLAILFTARYPHYLRAHAARVTKREKPPGRNAAAGAMEDAELIRATPMQTLKDRDYRRRRRM